jgi:alanyl-tRNA synthetase
MEKQRAEARKSWVGSGDEGTSKIWFELADKLGGTDFLGYSTEKAEGQILALVSNGALQDEVAEGVELQVIVNQSPFCAESGGQVGDAGVIKAGHVEIEITDTRKEAGKLWVHHGRVVKGTAKKGADVVLIVDGERRARTKANHSAAHLLNEVLRQKLGEHVVQKGSFVSPERLRFDISYQTQISREVLDEVERKINAIILKNEEVKTTLMTPEEAIEKGAQALFGEKYGDEVRVVSMGGADESGNKSAFSIELCGGTHVTRVGDIGLIKILSDSAIAAGVRRIEALTGKGAFAYLTAQDRAIAEIADILKIPAENVPARTLQMIDERKKMMRELTELRQKVALGGGANDDATPKQIAGVNFISRVMKDVPARDLKPMADAFRKKIGSGVIALVSSSEGRVSLVVAVTDDLTSKMSAVDLVRVGAEVLGGTGGGGRPDMAQAGGTNEMAMDAAIEAIEAAIAGIHLR